MAGDVLVHVDEPPDSVIPGIYGRVRKLRPYQGNTLAGPLALTAAAGMVHASDRARVFTGAANHYRA